MKNLDTSSTTTGTGISTSTKTSLLQQLLTKSKEAGQVGSKLPLEEQEQLKSIAKQLSSHSTPSPARIPLTGTHTLLHSQSPGGSSGAIGPFVGKVTQQFPNDVDFVNSVSLLDPLLRISLHGTREILDDVRIRVTFRETVVSLLGWEVVRKKVEGRGVWKMLFVGDYLDHSRDGEGRVKKLVRVMETPSLFIIEQNL